MSAWEVTAVRYGTLPATKAALYHRWEETGEPDGPQALDYFLYVLRTDGRTLVLDTGFEPGSGTRRGRTCLIPPREALARVGVRPASVERVVISHLHYDHIGNVGAFGGTPMTVPATEIDFWTSERARDPRFWAHVDGPDVARVAAAQRAGCVTRIEGRTAIAPGIEAIEVGGHSPGQHVFVVETARGPVVLASDAIHLFEELERRRPFAVFTDLEEMHRGYELVAALARERGALVVPGHDPLVSERFPAVEGTGGAGLRIA